MKKNIFIVLGITTLFAPLFLVFAQTIPPITPLNITSSNDIVKIFTKAVFVLFDIAGVLGVFAVLWAGVLFMTAGDSEERRKSAQAWLKWGIIGIIVAIISLTINSLIGGLLKSFL